MPIVGSGKKRSPEGANTESRTLDNEEWESTAHLGAQGRDGAPRSLPGQSNNQTAEMKGTGGFPDENHNIGAGSNMSHKQRNKPVRADHGQGFSGNTHDSRSASGTGHRSDNRGPRAINYNEDGSTNLNQSYVDRVLAMAQNNAPIATKQ